MDETAWLGPIMTALAMAMAAALVWEQLSYLRKASHLPGPGIVFPFLGNVAFMVRNPAAFWTWQAALAARGGRGLSWNVLFGRFVVFIRDAQLCHRVFANVRPDVFHLVGHPFGKKLFGEDNLIFMFGDRHKDLRRRLAPLFTTKALALYVSIQEKAIRKHVRSWLQRSPSLEQRPVELRPLMRDLNLEASQDVFAGPHLDPQARAAFTRDYNLFNVGLMALPIDLPGFAFRRATLAVSRLVAALASAASASRAAMSSQPAAPACLLDVWMSEELASSDKPTSDKDAGQHVFDFLFAAQDASTSSLVWMAALLESHPHVLRRVRDEQRSIRAHPDEPISAEQLRAMKYTEMVAKEVVRFRPPAPLVPHIAGVDFPISQDYTVPKGTIVFPSLLESTMQGFSQPDKFDPDRFSPERQEDVVYKRNWLMFGAGPHQCLGQRYAINQLMLFAAIFSMEAEWERVRTPGCDELAYVPTIIPKDGCLVKLRRRHCWENEENNTING